MAIHQQQDDPGGKRPEVCRAAWLLAVLAAALGCEGAPARSKPWRHTPDPGTLIAAETGSKVVAGDASRREVMRRRAHTIRIHVDRKPRHINPMLAPSVWTLRIASDTLFESLIRYEPPPGGAGSGPGHYSPGLARSWRVAPSGREIRLDLEPNVRFHNGARMTSVDVQFSLDAARSPRVGADHLRQKLGDVAGVDLISPTAVRVRLLRPNGYVLRALAEVPILPAEVYENQLNNPRGPVVGTGPYRLESWEEDVIGLVRFDGYWGAAPAIEHIEFFYEPDAARALTAAKRGELDFITGLIPAHYPEQASAPGLVSRFAPIRLRPPEIDYLLMDAAEPPFDDVRVRRAVAHLIDRKTVVKEMYGGLARPSAGPIWPGGPGDGAAVAPAEYDPALAARLLDEAGWRDLDKNGVRERDGQSLKLSLLVLDQATPQQAALRERVMTALRRTGFVIEPRVGSAAVLRNRLRDGQFDLVFIEWRGAVDQDLSALLETGGAENFGKFSSHRVDAALAALRAAWEPSSRAPLMGELSRALSETWPMAPITAPDPYGLLHRRVRGAVVWNGWIELRNLSLEPEGE